MTRGTAPELVLLRVPDAGSLCFCVKNRKAASTLDPDLLSRRLAVSRDGDLWPVHREGPSSLPTAACQMLGNAPDYVRDQERFNNPAADKHATTVKDALDELDHRIHPSLGACPHFKSCWEQVAHVRSLLPNLRPIRKDDRDKLFSRLNELCNSLKHLQGDYWLERRTVSDRVRDYVLNDLQSARRSAEGARDADGLREAEEKIERIRRTLLGRDRDSWGAQLLKEARDDCWEAYRQAREAVHFRRAGMQDLAYTRLRGPVATVEADAGRDNPFEVFSRIKELQREVSQVHLSKDQREDLRSTLRSAWERASARADDHEQKKQEKLGSTATMFEEIIERKRETIRKLETTIHKLRSNDIWSDEYGERLAGWISERERRISDIEHQISQLEGKLADVRDRLGRL